VLGAYASEAPCQTLNGSSSIDALDIVIAALDAQTPTAVLIVTQEAVWMPRMKPFSVALFNSVVMRVHLVNGHLVLCLLCMDTSLHRQVINAARALTQRRMQSCI
jgi:hypothetical protein